MKALLVIALFGNLSWAHCPPYTVERVVHTWRIYNEPEISKVRFDGAKREFTYSLNYTEVIDTRVETYSCWGAFLSSRPGRRTKKGVIPFSQPEEGNADFTLIREVRDYLREQSDSICP